MNLLFICNQAENRSRLAADLFNGYKGCKTNSAGLYNDSKPLNEGAMSWADLVFVFEEAQVREIQQRYPALAFEKRIINLEIEDIYNYDGPELEALLAPKVRDWIRTFGKDK